jgi:hypothetical protein
MSLLEMDPFRRLKQAANRGIGCASVRGSATAGRSVHVRDLAARGPGSDRERCNLAADAGERELLVLRPVAELLGRHRSEPTS